MLVWVNKHKTKLLVASVLIAGGYVCVRYLVKYRLPGSGRRDESRDERLERARLKEHIDSNRQTCQATILGFLPNVREVVLRQLDAEAITVQLRAKPVNKVALWENLKVISFSLLVSSVYACCLLTLLLRVELSISGGYMFCEVHGQQQHSTEIHKKFLSHLLQQGLLGLTCSVREAAQTILISYSLKHQLSCDGVVQILSDIRRQLSAQLSTSRPQPKHSCFLVDYILPKEDLLSELDSSAHSQQLSATRDILECVEFSDVLEGCVNEAFGNLFHSLTEAYHSAAQSQPTLALAKIIPIVSDHGQLVLSGHTHLNVVMQQLMADQQLQKLSQNIYEAFAHTVS